MAYYIRRLTEKEIGETLNKFSTDIEEVVNRFARNLEAVPPPRTIYHYTDSRGLGGILESGRIRLTDIFGLNDPTELRHGLSPAIKLMLDAARHDDRFEIKQMSGNLAAMLAAIKEVAHFFVCSFSEAGDDLGQWRAYADNGRGFALGFNAHMLEQAFAASNIPGSSQHTTFPVTYEETKLRDIHQQIVEQALPLISLPRVKRFPAGSIDPYMSDLLRRFCVPVIHAALFFKHKSYSNEAEYRFLQLFRADAALPDVKHLPRAYMMTRYREFDWRGIVPNSLTKIVIGPAANARNARQFVKECLRRFHSGTVRISRSKIPYRA